MAFGYKHRNKRSTIRSNATRGKRAENKVKSEYRARGFHVKTTGVGHDFKATRTNWSTGRKYTKYVEVKSGNAKLSPLQRQSKRYLGNRYVVVRR